MGLCESRYVRGAGQEQDWALHWIIRRVLSHHAVSTKNLVRVLGVR
jgi:hypothetical protein